MTTPAQGPPELAVPRRQSMWAPVFFLVATVRRIGITQFVVLGVLVVSGRLPRIVLIVAPAIGAVALAVAIARWLRFTFHIENDAIVVRRGVVSTERLSIPFDKVQSVSIDQEFLHRPIGLVRVRVDTAGSSDAELDITAVSRDVAEQLQRAISEEIRNRVGPIDANPAAPQVPATAETVVARTVGELILVALTRRPLAGIALVLPMIAVGENLGGWFGVAAPDADRFGDAGRSAVVAALVLLVVGGVAVLAALRVAGVVIRDYGLTLQRSEIGLHRQSGLFDRRSETSSISRIQQIDASQGVLQRRVGFSSLVLPTAGDSDALRLLGARRHELDRIRELVLEPDTHVEQPERRIDPAAALYWSRAPALVLVLTAVILALTLTTWVVVTLLALPLIYLAARLRQRRFRWGLTMTGCAVRDGVLTVKTTEFAQRRLQSVRLRRSFYERRRGLASVEIGTADSRAVIPLVPLEVASALRDRLLASVNIDDRPWF